MKSMFLTPVEVRWLPRWQSGRQVRILLRPVYYRSEILGDQTIQLTAGFQFDGQSIPRLVGGLVGHQDELAGTVHDWLYGVHYTKLGPILEHEALMLSVDKFLAYLDGGLDSLERETIKGELGVEVSQDQADAVYREILVLHGMGEQPLHAQLSTLRDLGRSAYDSGPSRLTFGDIELGPEGYEPLRLGVA